MYSPSLAVAPADPSDFVEFQEPVVEEEVYEPGKTTLYLLCSVSSIYSVDAFSSPQATAIESDEEIEVETVMMGSYVIVVSALILLSVALYVAFKNYRRKASNRTYRPPSPSSLPASLENEHMFQFLLDSDAEYYASDKS
jgi:hypothetical protein